MRQPSLAHIANREYILVYMWVSYMLKALSSYSEEILPGELILKGLDGDVGLVKPGLDLLHFFTSGRLAVGLIGL
jgi:hypothetical protein